MHQGCRCSACRLGQPPPQAACQTTPAPALSMAPPALPSPPLAPGADPGPCSQLCPACPRPWLLPQHSGACRGCGPTTSSSRWSTRRRSSGQGRCRLSGTMRCCCSGNGCSWGAAHRMGGSSMCSAAALHHQTHAAWDSFARTMPWRRCAYCRLRRGGRLSTGQALPKKGDVIIQPPPKATDLNGAGQHCCYCLHAAAPPCKGARSMRLALPHFARRVAFLLLSWHCPS